MYDNFKRIIKTVWTVMIQKYKTENVYLTKYYTATYVSNPMKTQEGYFFAHLL